MPTSLLFTGHMVDKPDRPVPRFPSSSEAAAQQRIAQAIFPFGVGRSKRGEPVQGFASAARGGDILFHEQCRSQGIATIIILPFPPDVFASTSVAGVPTGAWEQRSRARQSSLRLSLAKAFVGTRMKTRADMLAASPCKASGNRSGYVIVTMSA